MPFPLQVEVFLLRILCTFNSFLNKIYRMYLCVLDKKLASGFNAYVLYFQKLPLACQNLQRTCYRKCSEHGQIARNILKFANI